MADKKYPKLSPFEDLGFKMDRISGDGSEAIGSCPFCARAQKMYINHTTQQWQCKSAKCGKEGNLYTFLEEMHLMLIENNDNETEQERLAQLSRSRGIELDLLKEENIVWDGNKWHFPVLNFSGSHVNVRFYREGAGQKTKNLTNCEVALIGLHRMASIPEDAPIWMCEGEWDYLALTQLLRASGIQAAVLATPGAGIFKDTWLHVFHGRKVYLAYDKDDAGAKGLARAAKKLDGVASKIMAVTWPDGLPEGFDIRDFCNSQGTYDLLLENVAEWKPGETKAQVQTDPYEGMPALSASERPTFTETLKKYQKHLHFTAEMSDALRIIYAVIYSNQLPGDPLWLHIAGPPGSGKTELLMSTAQCSFCEVRSTVTPHSLVSGFQLPGGKDPSLIPNLIGKTFILKDFTEILQMNRQAKDEVYHILRGAYDGEVIKQYGHGLIRHYKGYFSMITGVTQAIFAEGGTSLGERFLIYHYVKGVGFDADAMILAAIGNSGSEGEMKSEMQTAAANFLSYRVDADAYPILDVEYATKLVGLAQFVAMLRGSVERGFNREQLKFRPQHEMGTRLAKQLKKLMLGLALTNEDYRVQEDDYRLAVRVALDTCIGFHLEIVHQLVKCDGASPRELADELHMPQTTARERLEDLEALSIVDKSYEDNPTGRGAPVSVYYITDTVRRHWDTAEIGNYFTHNIDPIRQRRKFRKSD